MFLDCDAKVRQFSVSTKLLGKKYEIFCVFSRFFLLVINKGTDLLYQK
nr:MAG TPA: hypothetical protein [Caudoviricetes sp.]